MFVQAVAGKPDGTFLVRERNPPNEYALTVMFNGKGTHHLLAKVGEAVLLALLTPTVHF